MNKKILLLSIGMFFILGVSAYTIGQIITRDQFINIDFDVQDYDFEKVNITITDTDIIGNYKYNVLVRVSDSEWEIQNIEGQSVVSKKVWSICRNEYTKSQCVNYVNNELMN